MTRIISLSETTDPTAVANQAIVYSKDVAGVTKLYVMLSDSTAIELGAGGGGMAIGSPVTSGTVGSALFVGAGGNLQQDNANFFWDDTNNRLGVGTAVPSTSLHVAGTSIGFLAERTSAVATGAFGVAFIQHTTTVDMTDDFGPTLLFRIKDDTAGPFSIAYIGAVRNTSDQDGDLVFAPYLGGNPVERMRITRDGRVGIGTVPSVGALEVAGDAYFYAGTVRTTGGGSVYIAGPGELQTDKIQHSTSPGGSTAIDIMVPISVRGGLSKFWGPTFSTEGQIYLDPRDSPNQPSIGFQWDTNATATGFINDRGYQAGTTQFRDLKIRDGKGVDVVTITGSTKQSLFAGEIFGNTSATILGGSSLFFHYGDPTSGAGNVYLYNGTGTGEIGFSYAFNNTATGYINQSGYQAGATQFRNLEIHNGKGFPIAIFTGSTKRTDLSGALGQKAHAAFAGSDQVATTAAVQTTNTTQTTVFTLTLPDTSDTWIEARVVARDTAGTERAVYGKFALVYREGGGATIQGSVQDVFADIETSAGLDATFTVSSNDVRLSVTGLAATTINWVAAITYQTVSGSA